MGVRLAEAQQLALERSIDVPALAARLDRADIAGHLDITPTAAKNLVNRVFQAAHKRPLFVKKYDHGAVRVGVRPELQERILAGRGRGGNKVEARGPLNLH